MMIINMKKTKTIKIGKDTFKFKPLKGYKQLSKKAMKKIAKKLKKK